METCIEILEEFKVRGFELKGSASQIPALWDKLYAETPVSGSKAEESFGVTLAIKEGVFHYLAGINAELAEGIPDTQEVLIPSGKFIVAKVEGGVEKIPEAFGRLMQRQDIQLRQSYAFERYIHPVGSVGYETEVWVAIL